jgi:hypothetical protein
VLNLLPDTLEEELLKLFARFGLIYEVSPLQRVVAHDGALNSQACSSVCSLLTDIQGFYVFFNYYSVEAAKKAQQAMDGYNFHGCGLRVGYLLSRVAHNESGPSLKSAQLMGR